MPAEALEDLEIERTDGVDEPATGRRFLIAKSEDAAELGANLEAIAKASHKALTRLAKAKGGFDKETVAALTKLAKLCDVDVEFTVRKESDPPEGEPKPEEPKPEEPKPTDIAKAITSALAPLKKSIDSLTEKLEKMDEEEEDEEDEDEEDEDGKKNPFKGAPKKKAESSQAEDDRPVVKSTRRKMGEGLFANIINQ